MFETEADYDIQPGGLVALPDGEAVVACRVKTAYKLIKLKAEKDWKMCQSYMLREDSPVMRLLYQEPWIFIIQANGTITKIYKNLSADRCRHFRLTGIQEILSADMLNNDKLLLITSTGEVWLYTTEDDDVKLVKDKITAGQLTIGKVMGRAVYIITDPISHQIQMYNQDWHLQDSFIADRLQSPCWTCVNGKYKLLVADTDRDCVSEIRLKNGGFVKDVISRHNRLTKPKSLSVQDSRVWVLSAETGVGYFDL